MDGAVGAIRAALDGSGESDVGILAYAAKFAGPYAHRTISGGVGHNLPQEAPQAFAQAIIDVANPR